MVFMVLIAGHTIAQTGGWDVGRTDLFPVSFGPPARLIGECLSSLDTIVCLRPATPPKEATYPFFEASRVGRGFAGADGFCRTLFCVAFSSTSRAFCGGGFVGFEKPKDGDAADNHDEGERYDKHPKADG